MSNSKNENIGPYLTFDEKWFRENQRWIHWLLNAPVLKIWFRWVLRIRQNDCLLTEKINLILPNQFHKNAQIEGDKIFATADFRTHWKYSKRIYNTFKYFWWVLHFWDWLVADRLLPKLSFGLFTLTQYPDIGNTFVSCDGTINRYINDAASTSITVASETTSLSDSKSQNTNSTVIFLANTQDANEASPIVWSFTKAFFFFDTSVIGAGTILNAELSLFVTSYQSTQEKGAGQIGLFSATGTAHNNNLVVADYFLVGNTLLANILPVNPVLTIFWDGLWPGIPFWQYFATPNSYLSFILNATGKSAINKTGVSKFATRWTLNSIAMYSGQYSNHNYSVCSGIAADNQGLTNDPKLVIDYSVPSTNKTQMII